MLITRTSKHRVPATLEFKSEKQINHMHRLTTTTTQTEDNLHKSNNKILQHI